MPIPPAIHGRRATPSPRHAPSHRSRGDDRRRGCTAGEDPWSEAGVRRAAVEHPAGQRDRQLPRAGPHREVRPARPDRDAERLDGVRERRSSRPRRVSDASIACAHNRAERLTASGATRERAQPAADGPRRRASRAAIVRCQAPPALSSSAAPITSAPSRLRGTDHAGSSTCLVSHTRQYARRGRSDRTPSSIRLG